MVEPKLGLVWVDLYDLSGPKTPLLSSPDIKVDYVGEPNFGSVWFDWLGLDWFQLNITAAFISILDAYLVEPHFGLVWFGLL